MAQLHCLRRRAGAARARTHTVYVKSLYRVAGQDYCRHHIIRAAMAAGVITEIRAGVAPVSAATRGAPSTEYDRPHQH